MDALRDAGVPVVLFGATARRGRAPRTERRGDVTLHRLPTPGYGPSARMRDDLAARGWPADRMLVVPHGFEEPGLLRLAGLPDDERDRVRAEVRRRYLPGGQGRLVVFAGRPSPHKGVHTLIRAVPQVVAEHGDTRFVLVGAQAPQTDDAAAWPGSPGGGPRTCGNITVGREPPGAPWRRTPARRRPAGRRRGCAAAGPRR
ncbi:hypothetical protein ACQP2K_25110 [Microbispora siamensis]